MPFLSNLINELLGNLIQLLSVSIKKSIRNVPVHMPEDLNLQQHRSENQRILRRFMYVCQMTLDFTLEFGNMQLNFD
jgi:hypothetical protein